MKNEDRNTIQGDEEKTRVVADMNIEGMPWHLPNEPLYQRSEESVPELSKKELRRITFSATLAGLVIGVVFLIVFFLFIMFSIYIWF